MADEENMQAPLFGSENEGSNREPETNEEQAPATVTELDMLKQRARMMGVEFSNNIGIETLKKRIQDKLDGKVEEEAPAPESQATGAAGEATEVNPFGEIQEPELPKKTPAQLLREKLYAEQMKLVLIRVTNLDPKKKDLPGEIFTIANEYLGTVRKYVPFGEKTDNGYHVPYCIYQMMKDKQFLSIKVTKVNGKERIEQQWVREFAIDVLDQLDQEQLDKLAAAQAAAGGMAD